MKFGLAQKVLLKIRKQPDEESLNRVVKKLEDEYNFCYTYTAQQAVFHMQPDFERMEDRGQRNSFFPNLEGEYRETDEKTNLSITFRPVKTVSAFLRFFFGFAVFLEAFCILIFVFGGMDTLLPMAAPVFISFFGYLLAYFSILNSAKKIIAVIEKCL